MIVVIRIVGDTQLPSSVAETLFRMRLRRKYTATILLDTPENRKLLLKVRNFVAYGTPSESMVEKLLEARGALRTKKPFDAKKIASLLNSKSILESGLKPFFRLHPPRKGIDSGKHVGTRKGVLGDHKEAIDSLVERML